MTKRAIRVDHREISRLIFTTEDANSNKNKKKIKKIKKKEKRRSHEADRLKN